MKPETKSEMKILSSYLLTTIITNNSDF